MVWVEAEVPVTSTVLTPASVTALVNVLLELIVTITALEQIVATILSNTASAKL